MRTIKTKYTLVGSELEVVPNVEIQIGQDNIIKTLVEHEEKSNILAIPGFFNAHVHAADIGLRGKVKSSNLHTVVGPGGIKQQYLSKIDHQTLTNNLEQAIREGETNGVLGFVDFREGGLEGALPYQKFQTNHIPYLRPEPSELSKVDSKINIGIRDVVAYSEEEIKQLVSTVRSYGGKVQIHVSEDKILRQKWEEKYGVSDLIWALQIIKPDAIVHATHSDKRDIEELGETNTPVIICPTSNEYFQVGKPPVQDFLNANITVGLGSDNAMVNPISLWQEIEQLQQWNVDPYEITKMATVSSAHISGLRWGIEKGNSNILLFEIPEDLHEDQIYQYITSKESREHLVDYFTASRLQSHN